MNWNNGKPPVDGWYWVKCGEFISVTNLRTDWFPSDENSNVEWLGPINPEDADELGAFRATLERIAQPNRCANPSQCAREALDGDWKNDDNDV